MLKAIQQLKNTNDFKGSEIRWKNRDRERLVKKLLNICESLDTELTEIYKELLRYYKEKTTFEEFQKKYPLTIHDLNNKKKELIILLEQRYYNTIKSNNGFDLDKTPNGKKSLLYQELFNLVKDKHKAWILKSKIYTPEFIEWFGDWREGGHLRDRNNEPLLCYHGGKKGLHRFDTLREDINATTGLDLKKEEIYVGTYFSNKIKVSKSYAYQTEQSLAKNRRDRLKSIFLTRYAQVYPVFIRAQNPYFIKARFQNRKNELNINTIAITKDEMHKIVEHGYDMVCRYFSLKGAKEIICFFKTNIKSIYNEGAFSPYDEDIFK